MGKFLTVAGVEAEARQAPEPLSTNEVSDLTGRPTETLRYWRWRGEGPRWYRLGRAVVYDRADVLAWLAEQKATTGSAAAGVA